MERTHAERDLESLGNFIRNDDRQNVLKLKDAYTELVPQNDKPVDFSHLGSDELADALVPSDFPLQNRKCVKTSGNGNCLFNAASIFLKGDESLACVIRLLSACELYLNAQYYSRHPILERAANDPRIFSKDAYTLFNVLLTGENSNSDLETCVKKEAAVMCTNKTWSSMLQVLSLPTILGNRIYSAYPDTSYGIRPLLNGYVPARDMVGTDKEDSFFVLWSRDGTFDSAPGSVFQPNHFCLIVSGEQASTESDKTAAKRKWTLGDVATFNIKKKKTHRKETKRQGTILSFLQKNKIVESPSGKKEQALSEPNPVVPEHSKTSPGPTITVSESSPPEQKPDPCVHEDHKTPSVSVEYDKGKTINNSGDTQQQKPVSNSEGHSLIKTALNSHQKTSTKDTVDAASNVETTVCNALCCFSKEPYQPKDVSVLASSVRLYKNRKRVCQSSWFSEFPWLTFCTTTHRVYCTVCRYAFKNGLITFSTRNETAYFKEGFNNWKKSPGNFRDHQKCETHREAQEKIDLIEWNTNVKTSIDQQAFSDQKNHFDCLVKQFQSLQYLLRQGLAIRGHTEDEGNFIKLQELRANDCQILNVCLKDRVYRSPDILNEQITLFGHTILRNLVQQISSATWFSIIADETRDISNREQLSLSIRWVDSNLSVNEDFVGMIELSDTRASTILISIKDVLMRLSLPLNNCRGQGYDGASNFTGRLNGVAVQIQNEVPQAIPVHCFAHCLNLSLQDSCRNVKLIRDAIDVVKEIVSLIKFSPKRQMVFEKLQAESGTSQSGIKPLCPTRWTVRTGAIGSVLENYAVLIDTMEEINVAGNDDYFRRAGGVANLMQKFETFFALRVSHMLFSATKQVSTTLQNKDSCIQDAVTGAKMISAFCDRQRNDEAFESFYESAVRDSINTTSPPSLPRFRKVPKKIDEGGDGHHYESPKDYFRHQYFDSVDNIKGQVIRRFSGIDANVLKDFETLILSAANADQVTIPESLKTLYSEDINMENLLNQLKLIPHMIIQTDKNLKRLTSIRTLCDIMNEEPSYKRLLPEVTSLLQLYFTIPVTTATAERSFSSLRRLKTYLRSTMTQKGLNNIMISHCYKDELDNLDIEAMAKEFVSRNADRRLYFGNQ